MAIRRLTEEERIQMLARKYGVDPENVDKHHEAMVQYDRDCADSALFLVRAYGETWWTDDREEFESYLRALLD